MKLFNRRNKNCLLGLILLFVITYVVLNYVNLQLNEKFVILDKPKSLGDLKQKHLDDKNLNNADNNFDIEKIKKFELEINNVNKNNTQEEDFSKKKRFFAIDGDGMGSVNTEVIQCSPEIEVEIINSHTQVDKADFSYFLNGVPSRSNLEIFKRRNKRHYYMVYAMESEPHSGGGESWTNADFRMWYNLDLSYPEPATYFDVKGFLPDLLAPPKVEFDNKETSAPLVWVLSNCAAFNGRESLIRKLMNQINIDSYGYCLRNKNTHTSVRMQGNIELYSKYKFVIAIENSNCEDYVTEKLVHAVASGSIPIVAGKDGKPNYLRYMPKNSYINVYDFKSVDDLVKHIKKVGSSKEEYEKYIHFKRKHNYTRQYLGSLPLKEIIDVAKSILNYDNEKEFFDGLIKREKSENKLCKIARHLKNTPYDVLESEINQKRINRPDTSRACLPHGNLGRDLT